MGAPDDHPLVGAMLRGTYRVTGVIDEGGMSTVLAAEHVRLHREVAVKVLSARHLRDDNCHERFRREAEILSQFSHPHIVAVLDFDLTARGEPYLVMERLDGETLESLLAREHALPLAICADIIEQIASALAEAHAAGIVHRDLKPGNVFVVARDPCLVKLLDFGIGKRLAAGSRRLTAPHELLGTPCYMSPEQATADQPRVDARTDQFALAVVAYEMMSGELPFDENDVHTLMRRIVLDPVVPLSAKLPGCPADVDAVLQCALSKNPAERYPDVSSFAAELTRAMRAPPARVLTEAMAPAESWRPPPRRPVRALLAGAIAMVLGVGVAGWRVADASEEPAVWSSRVAAVVAGHVRAPQPSPAPEPVLRAAPAVSAKAKAPATRRLPKSRPLRRAAPRRQLKAPPF